MKNRTYEYEEVAVPSYHRKSKECCISELQDSDVAYAVELKQDCAVDDRTASIQLKIWARTSSKRSLSL